MFLFYFVYIILTNKCTDRNISEGVRGLLVIGYAPPLTPTHFSTPILNTRRINRTKIYSRYLTIL